jgi:hypothetical protein
VVAGGGRVPASCGGAGQRGWPAGRTLDGVNQWTERAMTRALR